MPFHDTSTANHLLENWTYADATARGAATGFAPADVGKVAYQQDDGSYWRLADDSPITWAQIGGSSGPSFTGCVLRDSGGSAINLASGSLNIIPFDTEVLDSNGFHSTVTNTSRVTIPSGQDGLYRFDAFIELPDQTAGADWQVYVRLSGGGGPLLGAVTGQLSGSIDTDVCLTVPPHALAAGDYVELIVVHYAGHTFSPSSGTYNSARFSVERVN